MKINNLFIALIGLLLVGFGIYAMFLVGAPSGIIKEVPCLDNQNNVILEVTCEEETTLIEESKFSIFWYVVLMLGLFLGMILTGVGFGWILAEGIVTVEV